MRAALEWLASENLLALGPGRARNGKYFYPANHAALRSPGEQLATTGDQTPGPTGSAVLAGSPLSRREGERGEQTDGEQFADFVPVDVD